MEAALDNPALQSRVPLTDQPKNQEETKMMKRRRGRHVQPTPKKHVALFVVGTSAFVGVVLGIASMPSWQSVEAQEPANTVEVDEVAEERADASESAQEAPGAVVEPVSAEDTAEVADGSPEAQESAGRFVVPQVGLDAPLLSYALEDGIGDPPTWTDAYVVDGYGSPSDTSSGTSYVLLHSGYRGEAVGDFLTDRAARESHLNPGDRFYVDGVEYEVTGEAVHSKSALEDADASGVPLVPEVWEDVDGRLHLMTCLQRPQGRSVDVLVVTAQVVV